MAICNGEIEFPRAALSEDQKKQIDAARCRLDNFSGVKKHIHYKKDVSSLQFVDVYRVLDLFDVTHPAVQHAAKKVLCAGQRGAKDWAKDIQEAIDSLQRALDMHKEDGE